ncbi:hypothetical protein IMG5_059220 [Ichthyophthirius multifiliis]|uniref:V-type proton ATPase subunit F n=1 Tax=Ichthyophthirius multifiliis TaxID=5932 RepID=G0QNJ3_ICHMU|nr:hypothetical protein IMG5_059220 [Ichthyophthirius multifiliis]EGR33209.1 hypothetical protein IMG5_059220 [Ichthyophthirius multifiliis]|eukprot:XP_004037195.1 hypothetical protein IMG5_059220 [Ichthyophthirius multifiliis]
MSKKLSGSGNKLIAVIGDTDTVTGFLLTGIGERNIKGESNFLIVEPDTKEKLIEDTFNAFLRNPSIAVILVNQHIAEKYLRHIISNYEEIIPTILEIPSKDKVYEPKKDSIMQRANKLLYGSEIK